MNHVLVKATFESNYPVITEGFILFAYPAFPSEGIDERIKEKANELAAELGFSLPYCRKVLPILGFPSADLEKPTYMDYWKRPDLLVVHYETGEY